LAGLLLALGALGAQRIATFRAESMDSAAAAQKLESELRALPGVLDTATDPSARIVMVQFDDTKTSVMDISDAAASGGFSLAGVGASAKKELNAAKKASMEAFSDFSLVLDQTREARAKGRYGLVRNLTPAMKLRQAALADQVQRSGTAKERQLSSELSADVAALAKAAESKDKPGVDAALPKVRMKFNHLAKLAGYENEVAPPVQTQPGSPAPSLKDRLMERVKELTK
jgi:copper chaperone CopZ